MRSAVSITTVVVMSDHDIADVFRRDVAALYRERGFSRYEDWMRDRDDDAAYFLYRHAVKMFASWTLEGEEPDE